MSCWFNILTSTDSPKHRNKGQKFIKGRPTPNLRRQSTQSASTSSNRHSLKLQSTAHDTLVVVNRAGTKDTSIDKDPDIMRLQVRLIKIQKNYHFMLFI